MNDKERQQIALWVGQLLDDRMVAEEFGRLEQLVSEDPAARKLYLDLMYQDAHLRLGQAHIASTPQERETERSQELPSVRRPARTVRKWMLVIVATGLAASLLLMLERRPSAGSDTTTVIAEIVDSSDAEWGECTVPTAVGSKVGTGRLRLKRGLATVRFSSGALVTLESASELLIESPMQGTLLAGIAVVDVPESAHGFTIATPMSQAIDHGTAFAVIVDALRKTSSIEVIDGEVEVRHHASATSRRLFQNQQIFASESKLSDTALPSEETELSASSLLGSSDESAQRVTTAMGSGDDGAVNLGPVLLSHTSTELILVKNPVIGDGVYCRKGYFAFDLNSITGNSIESARFVLTLQPSGLGFAVRVPDCEFVVYGMTDESLDQWSSDTLDWDNAPANGQGVMEFDLGRVRELGRFVVARGQQYGQVSIEGPRLVEFLNSDANRRVTLIVARETRETMVNGLVHGFASRLNSTAAPPTLMIRSADSTDDQVNANAFGVDGR